MNEAVVNDVIDKHVKDTKCAYFYQFQLATSASCYIVNHVHFVGKHKVLPVVIARYKLPSLCFHKGFKDR